MLLTFCKQRTPQRVLLVVAFLFLSSLSILSHTPSLSADAGLQTLWQIGQTDQRNTEFALSPGHYEQFSQDGFYAVGRSDSRQSWPFIQPGPADSWAGSRSHVFQVVFGLRKVPTSSCRLVIRLLDTQGTTPPLIQAKINGYPQQIQLPRGAGDVSLSSPERGKPFEWSIPVPASQLQLGLNRLTITSLSGSWMLYDSLSFEAPPETEVAPVGPLVVESVEAENSLVRDKAMSVFRQPVTLRIRNFVTDACYPSYWQRDSQRIRRAQREPISLPCDRSESRNSASCHTRNQWSASHRPSSFLRPVKHWTIYLLPHSHVDIGYTRPQEDVRQKQIANLREALDLIKRTKDYPADAQFKWNLEVLWPMQSYLRSATHAQRQEFLAALRSGKLILNAYYGNLLTGLCSPEELLNASAPSLRVARDAGISLDTAMQTDTPGYTWGNVTAMAQAGVKYFSLGPNNGDRTGRSLIQWHDKPFYWISPSGKSKVLCWMTYGGYSLGHNLGKKLVPFIPGYLDGLEEARYPYDITCLRWCVNGDNGSPDDNLADTVREWNATHAFPRLVIAGTREPFVALEKRYSSKIPRYRGDFTPYWEDGTASTARETALKRNATDRLVQAQTLWAMRDLPNFPASHFNTAWEDAMLYSEHTWGAYNSISEPEAAFVKSEWAYKQAFALRADSESKRLLASTVVQSSAFPKGQIDIFNTESWTRTDLALIPSSQSEIGDRVIDATGHNIPSQRLADGTLAILVRDIPPFSGRRYSLLPGKAIPMGSATATETIIKTSSLTARIDTQTGAISELYVRGVPGNLVNVKSGTAVNDYFYLRGGNLKNLARSGPATVTVEDAGPLVTTLRIESTAPGARQLTRRVRLTSGIDRVDLTDVVDKEAVREKEGVHLGFSFNIPNPVMRMDMPLSVVRPEQDQLPAANRNWYPVQHWIDVSNSQYGVTWTTVDAPLVEVGGITANIPGYVSQTDPRWVQRTASSATFYSWVMNNHWHTNYKADQEGPVTFCYAIVPHKAFTPDDAERIGLGIGRPLLAFPASGQPPKGSLLQVSSPSVVVSELKPTDDGRAWIVRLWGASGRDQKVQLTWKGRPLAQANLSDTTDRIGAKVGPTFMVPGYGLTTLRINRV